MPFEALRFIHASSVLVDHPLHDLRPLSAKLRQALLETATTSFERIIEACVEQQVDFLLLSGDTFDERDRSLKARVAIREGFECLSEEGIQVFVIPGASDPASAWQAFPGLPDNVTVFNPETDEPTAILRDGNVIATLQGVAPQSPGHDHHGTLSGPFRIGVVAPGQNLEGGVSPTAVERLLAGQAVDYLALGRPSGRLWVTRGERVAHCSGPAVSLSRKDCGSLGCSLISVANRGSVNHELVTTSPVRREAIRVEVNDDTSWDELISEMRHAAESLEDLDRAQVLSLDWHISGFGTLLDSLSDPEAEKELFELFEADGTLGHHRLVLNRLLLETEAAIKSFAESESDETVWEQRGGESSTANRSVDTANPFAKGLILRIDQEHSLVQGVLNRMKSGPNADSPWMKRLEMLAERVDEHAVRSQARKLSKEMFGKRKAGSHDDSDGDDAA